MSAWIVGLALGAGYLINKNIQLPTQLELAEREYNGQAEQSTDGATSAEVRKAWADTNFSKFGDFNESMPKSEQNAINREVTNQLEQVEAYDAPILPKIEGVLMTFDRSSA